MTLSLAWNRCALKRTFPHKLPTAKFGSVNQGTNDIFSFQAGFTVFSLTDHEETLTGNGALVGNEMAIIINQVRLVVYPTIS